MLEKQKAKGKIKMSHLKAEHRFRKRKEKPPEARENGATAAAERMRSGF